MGLRFEDFNGVIIETSNFAFDVKVIQGLENTLKYFTGWSGGWVCGWLGIVKL